MVSENGGVAVAHGRGATSAERPYAPTPSKSAVKSQLAVDAAQPAMASDRWTEVMVPNREVEALELAGQHVLFHEGSQQLTMLNDTAAWIWRGLSSGYSARDITADLQRRGLEGDQAAGYVESILMQWLTAGWIHPVSLAEHVAAPAEARLHLSILTVGFTVLLHGRHVPEGLVEMLAPLRGKAPIQHELNIVAWSTGFLLVVDQCCRGFLPADAIVPAIKAALTERLTKSMEVGFLAHGALLEGPRGRVFLSGAPASGKSTLAMALFEAGFRCLSDDVVQIDPSGRAAGAPFAAALKAGAWPLLPGLAARLAPSPVHRRADGQMVRYLQMAISPGEGRQIDDFIVLRRCADGSAALEQLSGLEALQILLASASANTGRISSGQMKALVKAFARMRCHRLKFSHLADAVSIINRLGHVEG